MVTFNGPCQMKPCHYYSIFNYEVWQPVLNDTNRVQELRHFFISHLGLRGQLTTAFYRSVQDQREEQCVLDIELDCPVSFNLL